MKAETTFSLKDQLFNKATVGEFASHLAKASSTFNAAQYQRQVLKAFPELELKARIQHMVTVLANHLPKDYAAAVAILEKALPEPLDPNKSDDDFGHFIWAVPSEYVAQYGCSEQYLPISLQFLEQAHPKFYGRKCDTAVSDSVS